MPRYGYLDASAIVKLVAREPETAALEATLAQMDGVLTSRLSVVEVTRAANRGGHRRLLQRVSDVLDVFVLIEFSPSIASEAGAAKPPVLRSLDAIHLATAASLDLGEGEVDFITYDHRLADAAARAGLSVHQPR